ncbi:hypothetical protein [uncultured Flavobacterium sp.]|uniref:hypothetical protein n=1 Tax=uncultured Flavobacterium sp. TaxID=165435 RepID=UPI003081CB24
MNGLSNVVEGQDPFANSGITAAISIVSGGYQGYKAAQTQGLNPITGAPKPSVIAKSTDTFTKDAQIAYDKAVRTQQEPINMSSTAGVDNSGYVDLSKNPAFNKIVDQGGINSVYQGVNRITGKVEYFEITQRDPFIRFGEHFNSGGSKALLEYRVIDGYENLSRINARIIEQSLINQSGKENLLNIRNSIAPKYWEQYGIKP